jgi:aminopeptidase YwaD
MILHHASDRVSRFVLLLALLFPLLLQAVNAASLSRSQHTLLDSLAQTISRDSLVANLRQLEVFGIRDAGGSDANAGLNRVASWLVSKMQHYGYNLTMRQQVMVADRLFGDNLIFAHSGAASAGAGIIVGGHYDAVASGPGINDNGSGITVMLEMARVLAALPIRLPLTFVFFTGEEDGLLGSRVMADSIAAAGETPLLMFNLDMIGGISHRDGQAVQQNEVLCERDQRSNGGSANDILSAAYTDTLALMIDEFSALKPRFGPAFASDYLPFEEQGFTITGLYEYVPGGNPYYHRATDILANLDTNYVCEIARGGVAFVAHVSGASRVQYVAIEPAFPLPRQPLTVVAAFPNPFNPQFTLRFSLARATAVSVRVFSSAGRLVGKFAERAYAPGLHSWSWQAAAELSSGIYMIQLRSGSEILATQRAVLVK